MAQRILAVDDEPDVLMIVKSALQAEGYNVESASNGRDCIEIATEHPPDLILLDVMMPGMDGFEVVEKLRAEESTATVPIIMLTGLSDRAKIQEALSSGIDFYIIKPFDFDELITKVREALESREL